MNEENAMHTSYKQVIIMLKSLNMPKGKLVAQGSHASMGALLSNMQENEDYFLIPKTPETIAWLSGSFTKVVLKVETLEELETIYQEAVRRKLLVAKIVDNGRTCFNGVPTVTGIGIGPAHIDNLDFTSHLKLYN